jgi:hypothetical protein
MLRRSGFVRFGVRAAWRCHESQRWRRFARPNGRVTAQMKRALPSKEAQDQCQTTQKISTLPCSQKFDEMSRRQTLR